MSPQTKNTPPALAELSVPSSVEKTRAGAEGGSSKWRSHKPLPKEFQHGGFNYRQIARQGDVALYEQCWTGRPDPAVCFDVIRVRRREGFRIRGRFVGPAEVYPRPELWGAEGFTFTERNKAWDKFFEISLEEPAKKGSEVN